MRMDADREAHVRPERLDARGLRRFLLVARLEDDQRALEPRRRARGDDGVEVRGEDFVGEVAVASRSPEPGRQPRRPQEIEKDIPAPGRLDATPPCASMYSLTRSLPRL